MKLRLASVKRSYSPTAAAYNLYCYITMTSEWARMRLKSPASRLFTQAFIRAQIKGNIKAPRHWPTWGRQASCGPREPCCLSIETILVLFKITAKSLRPWGRLNIKMSSNQYRDPHVKDKTVPIPGKDGLYIETGPLCWFGSIADKMIFQQLLLSLRRAIEWSLCIANGVSI